MKDGEYGKFKADMSRALGAGKGGAGIRTRPQGLPVLISSDPSFPGSSLMPGPWPA
jgi:hypothetical protein